MNPKLLLDTYFATQQAIYDHFEYAEDWVCIPLDDKTDCYWMLRQNDDGGGHVTWSSVPFTVETIRGGEEIYSGPIYTQRFLPRWVYPSKTHTMISVDTQTDGNKFLMVFDNSKRCDDPEYINLANACWGEEAEQRLMAKCRHGGF